MNNRIGTISGAALLGLALLGNSSVSQAQGAFTQMPPPPSNQPATTGGQMTVPPSNKPVTTLERRDSRPDARTDLREDRQQLRRDERELKQDRRELRQDLKSGTNTTAIAKDRQEIRQDEQKVQADRQKLRTDRKEQPKQQRMTMGK